MHKLKERDKKVYDFLCGYKGKKRPSLRTIADVLGLYHGQKVLNSINKLKKAGLIVFNIDGYIEKINK